jgi:uncharacterized phage protein (TIGR01671 family)
MREIKFRVYSKLFKKVFDVIGFNCLEDGTIQSVDISKDFFSDGEYFPIFIHEDGILMQYTGLIDKYGAKICEGDIVACYDEIYAIEWGNEIAMFLGVCRNKGEHKVELGDLNEHTLQIIGNIYENSELIEQT